MRGVCFCEKAHFSILYTSLPSFTSCQGLSLLQMRAWSLNFTTPPPEKTQKNDIKIF